MDLSERRARIRSYLGIEQINHGQIYSFQIAVPPEAEMSDISPERYQNLADSLTSHKTNLIPVIVRPTDKYTEEEEYEVVYGADWCLVAKEIGIEKLWIWSFSLTDEQVNDIKLEMEEILGSNSLPSPPSENREVKGDNISADITGIEKLQKSFQEQLESLVSKMLNTQQDIIKKIDTLSCKLERLELEQLEKDKALNDQLEALKVLITDLKNVNPPPEVIKKVNQVNLNTLNAKELQNLNISGLGPAIAEAIIKLREEKGGFKSLRELLEVRRVTEKIINLLGKKVVCE
jgi:competence ComEA-like helix-hairpin-helix protein